MGEGNLGVQKVEFNRYTVLRVIRGLGSEFYTIDVAKHEAMRRAHGRSEESPDWKNYLQMTGKYLKAHVADFHLTFPGDDKPLRGHRWLKATHEATY